MDHRTIRCLQVFVISAWLAACAADQSSSGADAEGSPEGSDGLDDESAASDEPAAGDLDVDDDPYTVADPEEALAQIPIEMQPAEILDELRTRLLVPDLASGGRAMFTDIVTVQPGADVTFCHYVEGVTEELTYLHNTLGSQTPYGHHAILQYTTSPQEPGTRPCTRETAAGAPMGQILGGTGGEGTGTLELPSNVVSEIPAGAQFIINHHWINYGEEAIQGQAQMITIPPEPGQDLVIARALAIIVAGFNIAPGEIGEAAGECTFGQETHMLTMLGHQHEWGTHVRADRTGEVNEMIFDHDYTPLMVAEPLTNYYSVDDPYRFAAGDTVRMACQWNNTSDKPLTFPGEMCILFGWQLGAEKDSYCYNGLWI